ncbi:transporter substrate-binding domain-containing protein [Clostridium uliginosum]|nr:transporter substrate-binding domain-containing protein [Clostridium uliginosum]
MMKKLIKSIAVTSLLGVFLVGCGSTTKKADDSAKGESGKYIIACDAKFAPFSFEENGTYKGIDVELLDAISKEEGFKYELKPMDFNGIIPGLTSNQLDGAIAGISITDERKEVLDFSNEYFDSGLSIFVSTNNTTINGEKDLQGKTVAVKKGTAGEKYALDNAEKLGLDVKHFEDSPSMCLAVQNGNTDFALEDYPVIAYKIKLDNPKVLKLAGDKVTTVNYGFAVAKGKNKELLDKFNEGLKKIKENGEYDKIVNQYVG